MNKHDSGWWIIYYAPRAFVLARGSDSLSITLLNKHIYCWGMNKHDSSWWNYYVMFQMVADFKSSQYLDSCDIWQQGQSRLVFVFIKRRQTLIPQTRRTGISSSARRWALAFSVRETDETERCIQMAALTKRLERRTWNERLGNVNLLIYELWSTNVTLIKRTTCVTTKTIWNCVMKSDVSKN